MNLNKNPGLPAATVLHAGYFWVVIDSSTFIQIVFIDRPCVRHLFRCCDEYRQCSNIALASRNSLSSENHKTYLLKLFPQKCAPLIWIKPLNLWHIHQWHRKIWQNVKYIPQYICLSITKFIYLCICYLRYCFSHRGHVVRVNSSLGGITGCDFFEVQTLCHLSSHGAGPLTTTMRTWWKVGWSE